MVESTSHSHQDSSQGEQLWQSFDVIYLWEVQLFHVPSSCAYSSKYCRYTVDSTVYNSVEDHQYEAEC